MTTLHEIRPPAPLYTAERIISAVSDFYSIPRKKMTGPCRLQTTVLARNIAMYLARKLTCLTLREIGEHFGRDHSTVIHGIRSAKWLIESDADTFARVRLIEREIMETRQA